MSTKNIVLIAIVALVAYWLYQKMRKPATVTALPEAEKIPAGAVLDFPANQISAGSVQHSPSGYRGQMRDLLNIFNTPGTGTGTPTGTPTGGGIGSHAGGGYNAFTL